MRISPEMSIDAIHLMQEDNEREQSVLLSQVFQGVVERFNGPGGFRLMLQPLVAVALGIRDGLRDSKEGKPAYFIGIVFCREERREMLASTLNNILTPFIIGVVIDLVLQYFIFRRVRLIPAVIVGFLLIGLPYSLARGITNRISTGIRRRSSA